MSQAALRVRHQKQPEDIRSRGSNGARLFGIVFLLIIISIMVFSGLAVLKWINDTTRLPLSKLVVTGEMHYTTHDDIRQAILSLGSPGTFMSQNVCVIQQQIERLPWIKQVSVRKQWPDELKINVVEFVPVVRWNDSHMADADGVSFSIPVSYIGKENMPMLYGPEGSEKEVLVGYHTISNVMQASKFILKVASMTARRSWHLVTSDDVRIELGRIDPMKRLTRFIALYPDLQRQAQIQNQRVNYVDLRYDSGAAVSWLPVSLKPYRE